MLNAVFDTNVYVSAFTSPGGKAEDAYLLALRGKINLYASPAILAELAGKLREKFLWDDEHIVRVLRHISRSATVIKPKIKINILEDDPDNRVLECALDAKADLIVTGDRHLLRLKEYEGIGITRIADFLYTIKPD